MDGMQMSSVTPYIQAKIRILTNQLSSQHGSQSTSFRKDTLMTLIVLSEMKHTYLRRSPSQVSSPNSTTQSIVLGSRVHLTVARLISGYWKVCLVHVNRLRKQILSLRKGSFPACELKS